MSYFCLANMKTFFSFIFLLSINLALGHVSSAMLTSKIDMTETVDIRIFSNDKTQSAVISPMIGSYSIYINDMLMSDRSSDIFQIDILNDQIKVKTLEKEIGTCNTIRFVAKSPNNTLKVKSIGYRSKTSQFEGDLKISILNGRLKLINQVNVERYVAGVVESESGLGHTTEYYKVQAILCRTYALSHLRRHEGEGHHLCDEVHCQAYKRGSKNRRINEAVEDTQGLVIVDDDLNLITAAFHSNCGGQTVNSEDVWTLPTSYLKSKKDTFCLKEPHAFWERKVATEDWMSYLSLKYKYPVDHLDGFNNAVSYSQHQGRDIYFENNGMQIPLKTIRSDWHLKSTYFSIVQKKDSVYIRGKGYGHGVGMCQEGAMRMTRLGSAYKDVIHFYYTGVHLVDLTSLEFFRAD